MKYILPVLAILFLGVCGRCGVERNSVKTLSDPAASHLSYKVHPITIAGIFALPLPDADPVDRTAPYETTLYKLRACLTVVKHEADMDYHLVLSDGDKTMIAEIPDAADCAGVCRLDANHAKMLAARAVIDGLSLPAYVEVTGVGFWDRWHRQSGAIPVTFGDGTRHNAELHPSLRVTPLGSCP